MSYQVCQASTAAGPFTLATTSTTTSATLSSLTPGVTYYFEVLAVNTSGQSSAASPVAAATMPSAATTAGSPPTSAAVIATTSTTATLTWVPTGSAAYYLVYQGPAVAGPFTLSSVSSLSISSAIVSGLTPGTTYYFQVVAIGTTGVPSTPSAVVGGATTLF